MTLWVELYEPCFKAPITQLHGYASYAVNSYEQGQAAYENVLAENG